MIMYVGMYPRELQISAPSVFMIIGILLYILTEATYKRLKQ
jgi:Na+-transporting NADH:ubiquinone oxidoreductase subunit NqrD